VVDKSSKETQDMVATMVQKQIKSIHEQLEQSGGKGMLHGEHGAFGKTLIKNVALYQVQSIMDHLVIISMEAELKTIKAELKQIRELPSLAPDLLADLARRAALKQGKDLVPRRHAVPVPPATPADVISTDRSGVEMIMIAVMDEGTCPECQNRHNKPAHKAIIHPCTSDLGCRCKYVDRLKGESDGFDQTSQS
jgi:hypothetical protein